MTTSLYAPDLKVEVAFNAGFRTALASCTWTDISDYVELQDEVSITWGRQDEFTPADANTLTLTLDNRDGRFTPERSGSPYYPDVKVGRPIRVLADGDVRFTGYVEEWPIEWDGTDATAYAQVTATSRLAWLGQRGVLASPIQSAASAQGATAYYPMTGGNSGLGDIPLLPVDRNDPYLTAVNASGIRTWVLGDVPPEPLVDGATVLHWQSAPSSIYFNGWITGSFNFGSGAWSLTIPGLLTGEAAQSLQLLGFEDGAGGYVRMERNADAEPLVRIDIADGAGSFDTTDGSAFNFYDGQWHLYTLTSDGAALPTISAYVDGELMAQATSTLAVDAATLRSCGVAHGSFVGSSEAYWGRLAIYEGVELSLAQVQAISDSIRPQAGESAADRFGRIADLAAVPGVEVAAAGETPMLPQEIAGSDPLSLMREVEAAEQGVVFDARDGTLTLQSRASRFTGATALTLDVEAGEVGDDLRPTYGREGIRNSVTFLAADESVEGSASNSTSIDNYGLSGVDETLRVSDGNYLAGLAEWLVANYADPRVRIPSLSVDLLPLSGAQQTAALAATVGTRVQVDNMPDQSSSSSLDLLIEGGTETWGVESCRITFNVSDATPYTTALILDSATRGLLDTHTLA